MSLSNLVDRSNDLYKQIIEVCESHNNKNIKTFQDMKQTTLTLNSIIGLRRIWQKAILKLDDIKPNEKRQLIDQFYFNMIDLAKQALQVKKDMEK